eukprot:CAMPEP_0196818106 /NCGR_PEP_ID=MMETSP1362-20130617/63997_1 /TAXON_ID=163516 /ORGANISM="Leptocylindrus danicus, Strain CCMP1856" /LENGTH=75 /DNA_ID=CAMNT_0042196049 /DNA_START=20 /DNA_END=243 /DNA_ORIENTATION=+
MNMNMNPNNHNNNMGIPPMSMSDGTTAMLDPAHAHHAGSTAAGSHQYHSQQHQQQHHQYLVDASASDAPLPSSQT